DDLSRTYFLLPAFRLAVFFFELLRAAFAFLAFFAPPFFFAAFAAPFRAPADLRADDLRARAPPDRRPAGAAGSASPSGPPPASSSDIPVPVASSSSGSPKPLSKSSCMMRLFLLCVTRELPQKPHRDA